MIKVGKMVFVLFESGLDSAALSDNNNNRPASNEAKWTTQCGTGKVMVQRSSSRAVTFGGGLAVVGGGISCTSSVELLSTR